MNNDKNTAHAADNDLGLADRKKAQTFEPDKDDGEDEDPILKLLQENPDFRNSIKQTLKQKLQHQQKLDENIENN